MGKKLILLWVVFGFFTSHFTTAQTIKLGVRGGTFSPISLYEALAKKNPAANFNSFSTSRPYSLSLGATFEKNRLLFGANASIRRVDIRQTNSYYGYYEDDGFFETYDFDLNAGYKVVQTQKSSLNALVGIGVQTRYDYRTVSQTFSETLPGQNPISTYYINEIKPVSEVPAFLLLKLEGEFFLSNRWSTFFTLESNLFFGRNYYMRNTRISQQDNQIFIEQLDDARFSNNSISSTLGFRYALFKGKS